MVVASRVCILLCTSQGQHYLAEQLESIEAQTHRDWSLCVSDDGSLDGTHRILREFLGRHATRVNLVAGPKQGFAANFLSLATGRCLAQAEYYAFCDQDDVWEADKLERALGWLSSRDPALPALYCSRTRLIDADGNEIGFSPLFQKQPSFANALVQNIAGGNTMVFNDAARQLLIKAGGLVSVPTHDWWLYLVTAACGGQILYDPHPTIRYRQHGRNLIGSNVSLHARIKRAGMLLRGCHRAWSDMHIAALRPLRPFMLPENRKIYKEFCRAREAGIVRRIAGFQRTGVYRQTTMGNIGLIVAALSRKI